MLPFQQLSDQDVDNIIQAFELAETEHREWVQKFHCDLICHLSFPKHIFIEAAHEQCEFGRWYYHQAPDLLKKHEHFSAIDEAHKKMHDSARQLAQSVANGELITTTGYYQFVEYQQQLSELFVKIRRDFQKLTCSFDPLTGALNREACLAILVREQARISRSGASSCLAMVDIDHFKSINDSYGHIVGDKVLQKTVEILSKDLRTYDSLSRYGGEEFLMCFPDANVEVAADLLSRLRKKLADFVIHLENDIHISITASFGVAELRAKQSIEESIRCADEALYRAKREGRNRVEVAVF